MLPHVSLGASQLMKLASTPPRSYGRRHRSWNHGHVLATHNERRRGKRPAHHDQVHAWRLGHRHGHHDQAPATHKTSAAANNGLSPLVVKRLLKKNSEPHTWARPSVRLCVRPEFARCVHKLSFERRPTKTKFVLLNFPDLQWAPKLQAASEPTPPIQFPGAFLMWLRDSGTKEARHSFTSLWDLGAFQVLRIII